MLRLTLTRILITIVFCIISVGVYGQQYSIEIGTYYGFYQMEDLKNQQRTVLNESIIPFQTVEEVSSYWGYEAILASQLNEKTSIAIYFGFNSTGGRLYYSDFSGAASFDQIIKGSHFGFEYRKRVKADLPWTMFLGLRGGISLSQLHLETELILNNTVTEKDESQFNSFAQHIGPRVIFQKPIKNFLLQCFAGYEYYLPGRLKLSTNRDAFLIDDNGNQLNADWGGIRAGVSLGLFL